MANICQEPGFETVTAWSFAGGGGQYGYPHAGSYSALLLARAPVLGIGGQTATAQQDGMAADVGSLYDVTVWADGSLALLGAGLCCYVDRGDGKWELLGTLGNTEAAGWTAWSVGSFRAMGLAPGIRFYVPKPVSSVSMWFVDDVTIEPQGGVEMAITKSIRDAVVADLTAINGTGIFATTVAEVGYEPKRVDEARFPGVYLAPSSGVSSEEEYTERTGHATQEIVLQMFVKSATPSADMDTFLDDIRNSIERSTSNTLAVANVITATVSGWSEMLTAGDINSGIYYREATISVAYEYTRGSA